MCEDKLIVLKLRILLKIGVNQSPPFKIRSSFSKRPSGVCILTTSDYKSLLKFQQEIGFIIKRKKEKLRAGLAYYKRKGIRKYSPGIKALALDMLKKGMNYQEIGKILNTSHANIHDWEKASRNPNYYKDRWKKYTLKKEKGPRVAKDTWLKTS